MSQTGERGVALLEVLVAMLVLGTAAEAAVRLLLQASDSARVVTSTERLIVDESRLMSAVALLSRADLEGRLGIREAGLYRVEIARTSSSFYRVRVTEKTDPRWNGIETILYRGDSR